MRGWGRGGVGGGGYRQSGSELMNIKIDKDVIETKKRWETSCVRSRSY